MRLVFKKLANNWYCDLPNYPEFVSDLQMVCGADILCEELPYKDHPDIKEVDIITTCFDSYDGIVKNKFQIKLEFVELGYGEYKEDTGATYRVTGDFKYNGLEIWLCDVTKFVFNGEFPEIIYFNPIIQ